MRWKTCRRSCRRPRPSGCNTPDLSLTALCGCFEPPVSKSGLSHRMKKLEALAETLRKNLEQEEQQMSE